MALSLSVLRRRQSGGQRPSLSLDFLSGALDTAVTFTRASTATYFNSAGVLTSAAINEPRADYNPTTLAARGLLVEEARTNGIRNNTMQGAAIGVPGTNPTNWSTTPNVTLNGIAREVAGFGTEDGISYIDYRFSGTASAQTDVSIRFEALNAIAAASGQTWSHSFYSKLVAGSVGTLSAAFFYIIGTNGTTQTETIATITYSPTSSALRTQRFTGTGTAANASTTHVANGSILRVPNGVAVDFTIRIGLPQLELGAFATSVIPTTTVALARSADVASITGANFSSWYNAIEGTIVVSADTASTSADAITRVFASIGDSATFNESMYIAKSASSTNLTVNVVDNGVAQWASNTIGTISANTVFTLSFAYAVNNLGASLNGGIASTDSVATLPTVNTLTLGSSSWGGGNYLNGHIRAFKYYPRRLSNAELQALTV